MDTDVSCVWRAGLQTHSSLRSARLLQIGAKLLAGIEQYVPKDESDASIDPAPLGPFLAALEHKQHGKDHQFVTYRNNLNKIMGVTRACLESTNKIR